MNTRSPQGQTGNQKAIAFKKGLPDGERKGKKGESRREYCTVIYTMTVGKAKRRGKKKRD